MDTLFINGRIATLDPAKPSATAIAVAGGLIAAVGNDGDVMALRSPSTTVIDLRGRSVVPGCRAGSLIARSATR